MKENKYDDKAFFDKYKDMPRSVKGLAGAGEWHVLKGMLPDFTGKRVLDLGCGMGWHCRYAAEHGASQVVGVDISENMLKEAFKLSKGYDIEYISMPLEDAVFADASFDIVISSLVFHYVSDFAGICDKVHDMLTQGGSFVFSVEHPVFTANGSQDWHRNEKGDIMHWPVDRYFYEGVREAVFLGENVVKYHRAVSTYIDSLLEKGFCLNAVKEPEPAQEMIEEYPELMDELRRPMMLLLSAQKI